jgi:PBP1b-binding outer membrane lipoprotein LpoB
VVASSRFHRTRSISLLAIVGLLVAGCRPQAATSTASAAPLAQVSVAPEDTPTPQAEPSLASPAATAKPIRTELEATDPTTVNLASGGPTLVEFFAFW